MAVPTLPPPPTETDLALRLTDVDTVEASGADGVWREVCTLYLEEEAMTVLCRMLGYEGFSWFEGTDWGESPSRKPLYFTTPVCRGI